ncbi:hypothetical protein [Oceanithermus sp.]
MKRLLIALVGLLALASCSMAPITIDVLPMLGDNASGSQSVVATGSLDFRLPDVSGQQVSGYDEIPMRPASVSLDYELSLEQDGDLSGTAQVTFYMAASSADLWDSANQLGEAQQVDMSRQQQTVSGTLALNDAQIDALMSGEFVVGARLSGNVTGSANLSYQFERLLLKVAFF